MHLKNYFCYPSSEDSDPTNKKQWQKCYREFIYKYNKIDTIKKGHLIYQENKIHLGKGSLFNKTE